MIDDSSGAYDASYPTDVRGGAGFRVEKTGLALRLSADFSNVPLAEQAPAQGQVLVQASDTGELVRLDVSRLVGGGLASGRFDTWTAVEDIPEQTNVVDVGGGRCATANPNNPAHRGKLIGLTIGAALSGQSVTVMTFGALSSVTSDLGPDADLFISNGTGGIRLGALTAAPPTSGWRQNVGRMTGASSAVYQPGEASIIQTGDALLGPSGFALPSTTADIRNGTGLGYVRPGELFPILNPLASAVASLLALGPVEATPEFYGAVADGALVPHLDPNGLPDGALTATGTDNTIPLQQCFDWCRDHDTPVRLNGTYRYTGELTLYTSVTGKGTFLVPNDPNLLSNPSDPTSRKITTKLYVQNLAADTGDIPLSEVRTWTGTTRRSRKIGGLTGYRGRYVFVDNKTDTVLLNRRNAVSDSLPMSEGFEVLDNEGSLAHPLYGDWGNSTWTQEAVCSWKKIGRPITISGITFVFYNNGWYENLTAWAPGTQFVEGQRIKHGTAGYLVFRSFTSGAEFTALVGGRTVLLALSSEGAVRDRRPNTTWIASGIENVSGSQLGQGFAPDRTCHVTYISCRVDLTIANNTNYGWNANRSCGITLIACSAANTRRDLDAHLSKDIRAVSCTFPNGLGAHYAWGMGAVACRLGSLVSANPQVFQIAGGNFYLDNCDCVGSPITTALVRVRDDLNEAGGYIRVTGGTTTSWSAGSFTVVDAGLFVFDTGRAIELPRQIKIDTVIDAMGANPQVTLVRWLGTFTRALFPQDILVDGDWDITATVRYPDATPLTSTGESRTQIVFARPENAVGRGITATIHDLPGLWMQATAVPSTETSGGTTTNLPIGPDARLTARLTNMDGPITWRYGPGAYRIVTWDSNSDVTTQRVPSTSGHTSSTTSEYFGTTKFWDRAAENSRIVAVSAPFRPLGYSRNTALGLTGPEWDGAVVRVTDRSNRLVVNSGGTWIFMDGVPL